MVQITRLAIQRGMIDEEKNKEKKTSSEMFEFTIGNPAYVANDVRKVLLNTISCALMWSIHLQTCSWWNITIQSLNLHVAETKIKWNKHK